jgi:gelsolin
MLDWRQHTFPYDRLKNLNALPEGVDPLIRELYLSDSEFQERFGMAKEAFTACPKWRQQALKSKNGLF